MFTGLPETRKRPSSTGDDPPPKKHKTSLSTGKVVTDWTVEDVKTWWQQNVTASCQNYLKRLVIDNELTGEELISAAFEEILQEEVKLSLHKKRIKSAIEALKITEKADKNTETARPVISGPASVAPTVTIPKVDDSVQNVVSRREVSPMESSPICGPLTADGVPGIQIFVRNMSEKSITLVVTLDMPIRKVKQMVEDREGVRISEQRLIFGGKQLKDERTLRSYNVHEGHTLHLVLRLLGGEYEII